MWEPRKWSHLGKGLSDEAPAMENFVAKVSWWKMQIYYTRGPCKTAHRGVGSEQHAEVQSSRCTTVHSVCRCKQLSAFMRLLHASRVRSSRNSYLHRYVLVGRLLSDIRQTISVATLYQTTHPPNPNPKQVWRVEALRHAQSFASRPEKLGRVWGSHLRENLPLRYLNVPVSLPTHSLCSSSVGETRG